MSELTPKQEAFCLEYMKDLNGTQAAIRAGYAESGANVEGSRLLSNANVQRRVSELQAERSRETKIDAAWLLTRLAQEANADQADLYDDSGNLKPIHEWPKIWRTGLVAGLKMERVKREVSTKRLGESNDERVIEMTEEETRIVEVKIDSRVKRLELIGRHIGVQAFRTDVTLSNPDGSNIMPSKILLVAAEAGKGD